MGSQETLTVYLDNGKLLVHYKPITPRDNQELPDNEYIVIEHLSAEPAGNKLLKDGGAAAMIALLRKQVGHEVKIIFHPAANTEDGTEQLRLRRYYLSSGFVGLKTSERHWWTWGDHKTVKTWEETWKDALSYWGLNSESRPLPCEEKSISKPQ